MVLTGATLAVYIGILGNEFVNYDDMTYLYYTDVTNGLTWSNLRWALWEQNTSYWMPLTWFSYLLEADLFGLRPIVVHGINLLLHLFNVLLLYRLMTRSTGSVAASFCVALFWAVHPLNMEAVAWAAQRKDVLSMFFGLLAMNAYVSHAQNPRRLSILPPFLLFVLALAAKPMMVTLPVLMLLWDYWPLKRLLSDQSAPSHRPARSIFLEKLPFFAASAAVAAITVIQGGRIGAVITLHDYGPGLRIMNALTSYVRYLGKFIYPTNLAVLYPRPFHVALWKPLAATGLLILTSTCAWLLRRKVPYLLMGWLFYLVALSPVIGIVQQGEAVMADRFMYIPMIGLLVGFIWTARNLASGFKPGAVLSIILVVSLLPLYAYTSFRQVRVWKDSHTLTSNAVAKTENNYFMHMKLGYSFQSTGKQAEALEQFTLAFRIKPDFDPVIQALLTTLPDLPDPLQYIQQNLAPHIDTDNHFHHSALAALYHGMGYLEQAASEFGKALDLDPENSGTMANLGTCLLDLGRTGESIPLFRRALEIDPNNTKHMLSLGVALATQGEFAEARKQFEAILTVDPDQARARELIKQLDETEGKSIE